MAEERTSNYRQQVITSQLIWRGIRTRSSKLINLKKLLWDYKRNFLKRSTN